MSEMVERVAQTEFSLDRKFIGTQSRPIAETWEALSEDHKELYRTRARANIAALREPTEAMLEAGKIQCHGVPLGDGTPLVCGMFLGAGAGTSWQRMIDAALK